jgi:hypothetical protein
MTVVPTAIDGSWRLLMNKMFPVPFGTRVRIKFHEPIERKDGDAKAVIDTCQAIIAGTIDEWHGERQ